MENILPFVNVALALSIESISFRFHGVMPRDRGAEYSLDTMHLCISMQCASYETPSGDKFPVVFYNYGKFFGRLNAKEAKMIAF